MAEKEKAMATVTIVGAGVMGTATAYPLADNGHDVRLVGTHLDDDVITSCRENRFHPRLKRTLPPAVRPYYLGELAEAMAGADIIVSGVSSPGAHWIGQTIGPYLHPGQALVSVTKGLEAAPNGDLIILPDVLYTELPAGIRDQVGVAAIGGPCIAGELAGRRGHSCVYFGSRDLALAERLAAVFRTGYYHVWTTADLLGLEYGVAFKNAYALGVGLAGGFLQKAGGADPAGAFMHNTAAALFAQCCVEIDHLLAMAGAARDLAFSLPGAGDLYVTCQGGRSVRTGNLLGVGYSYAEAREVMAGETLEAVLLIQTLSVALPKLTARGVLQPDALPLMRALVDVVVRGQPVDLPWHRFFGGA
jgi:glycerol-3-phosphate dehydrogenase (NAD(P)+)